MKTVLKVALGIVLGMTVLIVGCVALIGTSVDEAEKEAAKNGITAAEFRSIDQGATQGAVVRKLGEPDDAQEFEQQIPEIQDQPSKSSCIYYPEKGQPLFEGRSFQLCFDDRKLTSKNVY